MSKMEAKKSFSLSWCERHQNWWVTNCPDCMVNSNEESIKQEGRREVVEWAKDHYWDTLEPQKALILLHLQAKF